MEVENLSKSFKIHHLNREIEAFKAVSFKAYQGEFIRIAGANGAGKSSLLRCLYRSYKSSGGTIHMLIDQEWINLTNLTDYVMDQVRQAHMGFVTQFLQIRPRISAVQWVMEGMLDDLFSWEERRTRSEELLDQLGLKKNLWNAYPNTFSGGEQQKVNLARGLLNTGKILLLDEPTASLDAKAREGLKQRIIELKKSGVTLIGVLHHPEDLEGLIDQTIELESKGIEDAGV